MRPIFCGNLDYDARQSDVERLFKRYGRVERVDMKSGKFSAVACSQLVLASVEIIDTYSFFINDNCNCKHFALCRSYASNLEHET